MTLTYFSSFHYLVQAAASVLGYTKDLWDKEMEPPASELEWNQMSAEQQEAAGVIGYDQRRWDADDESQK